MNNRIDPTSITVSVSRQTPKDDFGEVLARTVNGAARMGSAIIGTVGGMPIVSAAVSAVTGLVNQGARSINQAGQSAVPVASVPGGSNAGSAAGLSGLSGAGPDKYSDPMVDAMYRSSLDSLHLQAEMQQESREYNAISNVLKVRHDSAKAAINNIR